MDLRDFLIEAVCDAGHTSSIVFRGYTASHVARFAEHAAPRCGWHDGDGLPCGRPVVTTTIELGASEPRLLASAEQEERDTLPAIPSAMARERDSGTELRAYVGDDDDGDAG